MKVLALVDHLRDVGFPLGLGDHIRAQSVAARVAGDHERTRSVLRAVLVRDRADNARFNAAFDLFFTDAPPPELPSLPPVPPPERVAKAVGRVLVVPVAVVLAVVTVAAVAMYALRPEAPAIGTLAPRKPPPSERQGYCPEPDAHRDRQLVPFTRETRPFVFSGAALVAGGLALAIFGALRARQRARSWRDRFLPGPWDWRLPIAPHEHTPVFTRDDIHRAAALLGRAHDRDRRRVSLRETVTATARRGGFPTFVHRPAERAPTVGFVLDASPSAAPWRLSATELVERLRKTGAPVRVWWYRGDVCRVSRTPQGDGEVSLASLHAEVDALIVVGEPDVSARDIAPVLRRFARKLWLHPLPPSRWSPAERALAALVPMEHASVAALARLAGERVDAVADASAPWSREVALFPGSPDGVAALETYLGAGFRWLCAAAVARRPERDVARLLGPMLGPSRLPWSAWLRLATLPWFEHDEWPEALRDELLRRLSDDARRALRIELLRRMEETADDVPKESSAWWQRELELATVEHELGRENVARQAELMASPMRPAVVVSEARTRVYARALSWRQAGAELAVAGLGASVVAGGALAWGVREVVTEHRETLVQRPPRMVPCQRCPEGMVLIPEGEFTMGSPEGESGADENERPQHRVHLSAFCIDRTEVSVGAFRAYWNARRPAVPGGALTYAGGRVVVDQEPSEPFQGGGCTWSSESGQSENDPINCVNWYTAQAFCAWRGGRLPTEAQWEYAARGTEGRVYPWGNQPPDTTRANLCGQECNLPNKIPDWNDGFAEVAPVEHLPAGASPFGVLGMAGNVWEWVADGYASYASGSAASVARDPVVVDGTSRVLRGGSWLSDDPSVARAAFRSGVDPRIDLDLVGFRCSRDTSPSPPYPPSPVPGEGGARGR